MQYTNFSYQEGNAAIKRTYTMSLSFYQQLINMVDLFVDEFATYNQSEGYQLNFSDLPDECQGELIALAIEEDGRDISDCFYENADPNKDNITAALIGFIKNNSYESGLTLSHTIRKNSVNRYAKRLQDLINQSCGEANGYRARNKGFDE